MAVEQPRPVTNPKSVGDHSGEDDEIALQGGRRHPGRVRPSSVVQYQLACSRLYCTLYSITEKGETHLNKTRLLAVFTLRIHACPSDVNHASVQNRDAGGCSAAVLLMEMFSRTT